ncbi:hypothetical protein H8E52_06715 [bacterium]|nr:hypothetical protein [bacterium]
MSPSTKGKNNPVTPAFLKVPGAPNERAIPDMPRDGNSSPLRNRRNPREQRRDLNLITRGNLHFAQVQGAVMKNL